MNRNNLLGRPARILVIDDERHIARFLRFVLEKEGYDVAVAYSGEQALEAVEEFDPDAMLLDLVLPTMSGLDVLKRLRANPDFANLVVVVLSASLFNEAPAKVLEAGANTHCTKPIAPSSLLRKLMDFGIPPTLIMSPASPVCHEVEYGVA